MKTTTKTTYVLCADVAGRAYYVEHLAGLLPGKVYTSMPKDAKQFATKRAADAMMRKLNAGRVKHWVEQVDLN